MAVMRYEARIGELDRDVVAETIISCLDARSKYLTENQSKRFMIKEVPRDFCEEESLREYGFGNSKRHNCVRVKKTSESFGLFTHIEITGDERQIKETKSKLLKLVAGLRLD